MAQEIERRSHSILGKIELEPGPRDLLPGGRDGGRFSAYRVALVGEAAHLMPPIGAQGLNLGCAMQLRLASSSPLLTEPAAISARPS